MKTPTTAFKLALIPLALAFITACSDNNSNDTKPIEPPTQPEPIAYGPLNQTSAIVPATSELATKDRLMVNGNTSAVIKALDLSSHVDGGIDPTLYLLGNTSPDVAAANQWAPNLIPEHVEQKSTEAKGFYALHGDTRNSDEVQSVTVPESEITWIAETNLVSLEGGVFDQNSHIYSVPLDPVEDIYLVSIDGETGERRWHLPNKRQGQGGAPLVLADDNDPTKDIIYIGSYEYITAVNSSGEVLWDVKTGLTLPEGASDFDVHNFGVNYHAATNSVIALYADGNVVVHDKDTGRPLLAPYALPGAPAKPTAFNVDYSKLEPFVRQGLSRVFENTMTFFDGLNVILGGGHEVANYFGIDQNSGRIFIASTAPDEADGEEDGMSALGALYAMTLDKVGGQLQFNIEWRRDFEGGSAATPTLSFDGTRVYTADSADKMLAIDAQNGDLIWDFATDGGQIIGSVAVSREGNEIYAATGKDVFKVLDMGNCAGNGEECNSVVWNADIEGGFNSQSLMQATPQAHIYANVLKPATEGFYHSRGATDFEFKTKAGNMVLAGITANGIIAQTGYGYLSPLNNVVPFQVSQLFIDRQTGEMRYSTPSVEESVSVMAQAPNGNVYMSNSPLRRILNIGILRAVGHATNNEALKYFGMDILGGVAKFTQKSDSKIRLAQESALVVIARIDNLLDKMPLLSEAAVNAEITRLNVPMAQFASSLSQARDNEELSETQYQVGLAIHTRALVDNSAELEQARDALQGWLDL